MLSTVHGRTQHTCPTPSVPEKQWPPDTINDGDDLSFQNLQVGTTYTFLFKLIALQLASQLAIFSAYHKAWSMHAVSTEQTVLLSSNCQLHVALFKYAEVVELFFCREDIWTVVYLTLRCLIYVFELPLFKHRGRLLDRGIESPLTQLYNWYSSP